MMAKLIEAFRSGVRIESGITPDMLMGEFIGKCQVAMAMLEWQFPDSYPAHRRPPTLTAASIVPTDRENLTPETIELVSQLQSWFNMNAQKLSGHKKLTASRFPQEVIYGGDVNLWLQITSRTRDTNWFTATVAFHRAQYNRLNLELKTVIDVKAPGR